MTSTDFNVLKVASCFCGTKAKQFVVKKEGAHQGKQMFTCANAIYNARDKKNYGGCVYMAFEGDVVAYCAECDRVMRLYKNILSTAECMNEECSKGPEMRNTPVWKALDSFVPVKLCECTKPFGVAAHSTTRVNKNGLKEDLTSVSLYCKTKPVSCGAAHGALIHNMNTPSEKVDFYF